MNVLAITWSFRIICIMPQQFFFVPAYTSSYKLVRARRQELLRTTSCENSRKINRCVEVFLMKISIPQLRSNLCNKQVVSWMSFKSQVAGRSMREWCHQKIRTLLIVASAFNILRLACVRTLYRWNRYSKLRNVKPRKAPKTGTGQFFMISPNKVVK